MKKILKVVGVVLCLIAFTQNSNAQVKFSAGLDVGKVMQEGYGLLYGVSVGAELPIGDNMGVCFNTGYDLVGNEFDGLTTSMIPLMGGFKYYFSDNTSGAYGKADFGMTQFRASGEGFSSSSTDLTFGAGAGYLVNENIDLGLRYNIINGEGESTGLIALRAAYNF